MIALTRQHPRPHVEIIAGRRADENVDCVVFVEVGDRVGGGGEDGAERESRGNTPAHVSRPPEIPLL